MSGAEGSVQTAVGRVVNGLSERIHAGTLTVGDRLPGEAALAAEFSVSRPVLREALGRLRERGYLVTVNGSGSYVRRPDASSIADALRQHMSFAEGAPFTAAQLFEARAAIEVTAARRAAERATAQQCAALADILRDMSIATGDPGAYAAADMSFHVQLAKASGNPLLALVLAPLVEAIVTGMVESHAREGAEDDGARMHARILECVREQDADGAAAAMAEHLQRSQAMFPEHLLP